MSNVVGQRLPWRVMRWLNVHWPRAFQLLRYGTSNVNTAEHWDDAWRRHGRDGYRATGEILALLHVERRCDCSGVDIAPSAVAAVRARGFRAETTVLPAIPHPDAAFDVVVCTETLEHVSDARATLREIRRVLRPDGRLLLSVPDGTVDEEEVHVHRFSAPRLERELAPHFAEVHVERLVDDMEPTLFATASGIRQ